MADIDSHVTVTVRAFRVTNGCMDDWDVRPPCFVSKPAVNNAALTLGGVLPPSRSFIDRGQPRLPLSLPGGLRAAGDSESPAAYATRMKALEQEVRARLHAAQRERTGKAALDPGRVDRTVTFQVGDRAGEARCGPRTRSCSTPPRRARRPRWGGPCTAPAAAGTTPTPPRRFKCSPTGDVGRLRPHHPRAAWPDLGPAPGPAGPAVAERLLDGETLRGRTCYLVRLQGRSGAHPPTTVLVRAGGTPRRGAGRIKGLAENNHLKLIVVRDEFDSIRHQMHSDCGNPVLVRDDTETLAEFAATLSWPNRVCGNPANSNSRTRVWVRTLTAAATLS